MGEQTPTQYVNITNLLFTNASLSNITSDWYPDAAAATSDSLEAALSGLAFNMSGAWHAHVFGYDTDGNVTARLQDAVVRVVEHVNTSDGGARLDGMTCLACSARLEIVDPRVTGSTAAAVLDVLVRVFTQQLARVLERELCHTIQSTLTFNTSALADTLVAPVVPIIDDTDADEDDEPFQEPSVDLQQNIIVDAAQYLLNNLSGADGVFSINSLIGVLANNSDGRVSVRDVVHMIGAMEEGYGGVGNTNNDNSEDSDSSSGSENEKPLFEYVYRPKTFALNVTVGVRDVVVDGLNTWHSWDLARPRTRNTLWSTAGLARLGVTVAFYVNVSAPHESGNKYVNAHSLWEEGTLVFGARDNTAHAVLHSVAYGQAARFYTNRQCMAPSCIGALFDADKTALRDLVLNTTLEELALRLRTGTIEADVSRLVAHVFALVRDNCAAAVPRVVNTLVHRDLLAQLNRALATQLERQTCPNLQDPVIVDLHKGVTTGVSLLFAAVFAAIAALPSVMRWSVTRCSDDEQGARPLLAHQGNSKGEGEDGVTYCWPPQLVRALGAVVREFGRTDEAGASLFLHPRTSTCARYGVPLFVLGTVAFFVSAHTAMGAMLTLTFQLGDLRAVDVRNIQDFGLISGVRTTWHHTHYAKAVLTALYFVALPYILLVALLVCWFVPPRFVAVKTRGMALAATHWLAKMSLVGPLMNVIIIVALRLDRALPVTNTALAAHPLVLLLHVDATYGYTGVLGATITLLILTYVVLSDHRALLFFRTTGIKTSLPSVLTSSASSSSSSSSTLRQRVRLVLLPVAALGALGACLAPMFLPAISVNYEGMIGLAVDALGANANRTYTVAGIGSEFPLALSAPRSFAAHFTQSYYFAAVFLFPFLDVLVSVVCAVVPMRPYTRKVTYYLCENFHALAAADVMGIALVAAVLQIRHLIRRMSELFCAPVNPYINTFFQQQYNTTGVCAAVDAHYEVGTPLLVVASVAVWAATAYFQHRMRAQLYTPHHNQSASSDDAAPLLSCPAPAASCINSLP